MPDTSRRARRGLAIAEIQELAALRVMMRSGADITEEQRRRWFELSHRHDLTSGADIY